MKITKTEINTDGMSREQIAEVTRAALCPHVKPQKPLTLEELNMNLFGHTRNIQNRNVTRDSSGNIIKVA